MRGQISQDSAFRISRPTLCKAYGTAELVYGTAHVRHVLPAWSGVGLCGKHRRAPPKSSVCWLSRESGGCRVSSMTAAPARRE